MLILAYGGRTPLVLSDGEGVVGVSTTPISTTFVNITFVSTTFISTTPINTKKKKFKKKNSKKKIREVDEEGQNLPYTNWKDVERQ